MARSLLVFTLLAICAGPLAALADWTPEDPPANSDEPLPGCGLAVNVTTPLVLADDFACTETGWVTQVRMHGPWKHDCGDPPGHSGKIEWICLDFHANDDTGPYSKPGELLWEYIVCVDAVPEEAVAIARVCLWCFFDWYDPTEPGVLVDDYCCVMTVTVDLDKILPPQHLFFVEHDPQQAEPTIYWLSLEVGISNPHGYDDVAYGWNSPGHSFGGAAVWRADRGAGTEWDVVDPPSGGVRDLRFDLVITPVPEPSALALVALAAPALLLRKRR
jgi:hypothetical protein